MVVTTAVTTQALNMFIGQLLVWFARIIVRPNVSVKRRDFVRLPTLLGSAGTRELLALERPLRVLAETTVLA